MSDVQKWLLPAGLLALGWLIHLLAPVLTPFLAAALLAYLGDPLADRLAARKLPRVVAVLLVFVLMLLLIALALLLVVPVLERQIIALLARVPQDLDWLQQHALPWIENSLNLAPGTLNLEILRQTLGAHWQEAGGMAGHVFAELRSSGMTVLRWITNLLLIPVLTFYLLRDWDLLVARMHELLPRPLAATAGRLARESDQVLGAFLRGQLAVMLALGAIYSLGLWIAGVQFALLIGLLSGLLSFVPYLGFSVGLLSAGFAVLMQTHEAMALLPVMAVFGVGQLVEGTVLTPLLVGDRIGLHPVAVIFAVLAGGELFGFVGILLALPTAAVIAVLLRHAHERYRASSLYEGRAAPDGPN